MTSNGISRKVKEVEDLYKDIIVYYEQKFRKNIDIIRQNVDKEYKLEDKINTIQKDMKNLNNDQNNHYNNNREYNLTPSAFKKYDEYKKKLEYIKEVLEAKKKNNEEENKSLLEKNYLYLDQIKKFEIEKIKIVTCITNREFRKVLQEAIAQTTIYNDLHSRNEEILNNYLHHN